MVWSAGAGVRRRVRTILVLTAAVLAAASAASAASSYVPWTEQGGAPDRDHSVTTPYANPDPPTELARVDHNAYGSASTPIAIDLDGDDDLEVVIASDFWEDYGLTYATAYDWSGSTLAQIWRTELPFSTTATTMTVRLAAGDLDGDGTNEVVTWQSAKNDGGPGGSFAGTMYLDVLNGATGARRASTLFGGFDEQGGLPHPAIGDVDGDGSPEIVVGDYDSIEAFRFTGTSLVRSWAYVKPAAVGTEFALGEVDSSHQGLEIVHTVDTSSTAGYLLTCRPSASAPNCSPGPTYGSGPFGVALVDMDADGQLEAATGARSQSGASQMMVWEPDATGRFSFKSGWKPGGAYLWNTPAVGDVNRDGVVDFVNAWDHNFPDITDGNGHVYAAEYDAGAVQSLGSVLRTGLANVPDEDFRVNYGGALGNVIGDENLEYVYTDKWGDVRIIGFDGSGSPSLVRTMATLSYSRSPTALADINGDCALDIIYTDEAGRLWLWGDSTPRGIPTAVTALGGTESGTKATLTWAAPTDDGDRPILHYNIYRGLRNGAMALLDTVEVTGPGPYTFTDLTGPPFAAEVDYQVAPENCMGEGPLSPRIPLDVHLPPQLAIDTGTTLEVSQAATVSAALLAYVDDLSGPAQVTYKVLALPTLGRLETDAGALAVGSTFTQQDLADGLVRYVHEGTGPGQDNFTVEVADHHGKVSAPSTHLVHILSDAELRLLHNEGASVRIGEAVAVNDTLLEAASPDAGADAIVFTVTATSPLGDLLLDGVPLAVGDTFTQQDLADGRLTFAAGSIAGETSFAFLVGDGVADQIAGTFAIQVVDVAGPQAVIVPGPAPYLAGREVEGLDASLPGEAPLDARHWTVTDPEGATVATGQDPYLSFLPAGPGRYTVTLEVIDADGRTDVATWEVEIGERYKPPFPQFHATTFTPAVGEEVTFWDATERGTLRIVALEWDFASAQVPATGPEVRHTFTEAGSYPVTLRVVDELGQEYFVTHVAVVGAPEGGDAGPGLDIASLQGPAKPFAADAGPDQVVLQGSVVALPGSFSGLAGEAVTFEWSHAGGVAVVMAGRDQQTLLVSIPYLAAEEAESVLRLVVRDAQGRASSPDQVRLVLRAEGQPSLAPLPEPVASFVFAATETGLVAFRADQPSAPGQRYVWDFGGETVETDVPHIERRFASSGDHTVRLRVEDAFGRVAEGQRTVVIAAGAAAGAPDEGAEAGSLQESRPPVHPEGEGWAIGLLVLGVLVVVGAVAGAWWLVRRR